MTTFLFVLFTISFFISAPFYTANIPQVARFVNNNLFEFSDFIRLKRLKRAIHCLFMTAKTTFFTKANQSSCRQVTHAVFGEEQFKMLLVVVF